jgi:parvulin-like peptidyl-prolyl isomerase
MAGLVASICVAILSRRPMKYFRAFLIPAVFVLLAAGCGGGGPKSVPGDAVAVVGSEKVSKSDFDALITQAKTSYTTQHRKFPKAGTSEYTALRGQAMQFLVERAEFDQKAKDLGIKVTDKQVDDRLAQIKKQYFTAPSAPGQKPKQLSSSEIEKKYNDQLKKQGLTDQQVHDAIRGQLIREAIFNKVTADVKVSSNEVDKYYKSHKRQYQQPKQPASRDVRHILVKEKALANQLYTKLKGGADFAALAKRYSQDPGSKTSGGKLTVSRGQTVPQFDKVAFSLKTKAISKPVHTAYGWHIIQALSSIRPPQKARPTPLSQVKEAIKQQLLQTKRQQVMTKWLAKTRKEFATKIAYQPGYAPPATTATTATTSK